MSRRMLSGICAGLLFGVIAYALGAPPWGAKVTAIVMAAICTDTGRWGTPKHG